MIITIWPKMDTILATRQVSTEEEKSDETFIAEAVDSINEMTR
jgi:hypothetical protein